MLAPRIFPSLEPERPGRAPSDSSPFVEERTCLAETCDGSGWLLDERDIAHKCECRAMRKKARRNGQNRRILGRYLALSLDAPPLTDLATPAAEALCDYCADVPASVSSGRGLWFAGDDLAVATCTFVGAEALRSGLDILCYPGDELLGRLRRIGAEKGDQGIEEEIDERLAEIDLLVLTELDAPASPDRYPEPARLTDDDAPGAPPTPYAPAMTDTDFSQLFQVVDQRWMRQKATVLSTQTGLAGLEDRLLHVSGWPDTRTGAEPRRRVAQVQRLLFRLRSLSGGGPLSPQ
ncbi:MAG TPA: hypothetical protein VFJ64_02090 [Solirubrobacterales bacterium]|nr:hypothetical protein [Solirubrobacterales bacterium]